MYVAGALIVSFTISFLCSYLAISAFLSGEVKLVAGDVLTRAGMQVA